MAFMMEKILTDARKLANRLKEHDGSTDNLVTQMTTLNKKIDSMKTFQENLPDLNELVLRKPRSTVKLGLSQENSQIRELEQENKELKQSLEEHELALELIMSRYRQQVAKLLVSNKVDESMMYKETVQAQEVQDKAEHIHEMGSVMWKAISDDDRSMYDTQQLLAQLRIENEGMRELLHICSSSGNPLRISDRQTQTDGLSLFSSTIHNESSAVSPAAASGACRGGNVPCTPTTVVTGATMKVLTALKSLKLGEKDSLRDGRAAGGASKAGEERDEQASVVASLETASAFVLPSDAFASSSQSTSSAAQESNSPEKKMTSSNNPEKMMTSSNSPEMMTSSNSPEKMMTSSNSPEKMMTSSNNPEKMMTSSSSPEKMTSSSEPCSSQGLTTTASNEDQQQTSLGKGTVEVSPVSSSSSAVVATDKSNEVEEQEPTIPCTSETADTSSSQETLSEPTTPRLPELVLENHADENHIPNDDNVVETLATDDNDGQSRPSVVESVVAVGATQELDNSPRASSSSPLSNTTTASSTTSSSTTTESTSSSSQSRHLASSSTLKNQTNSPKSAALSSGKHASSPSGGTPRNPSSGHVTPQKTAATPSSGSSTSRPKHGATTTPSGVPSKTPTRSPAARDSAPGSSSGAATAVKLTSSGSPSVHSAKTSAAAHSPRATPIRIKAARQPSPVVASVASPATNSSPSTTTTTTSCVPLDSNGNSHTTTTSPSTVLNEISNINNMPKDATVDGQ